MDKNGEQSRHQDIEKGHHTDDSDESSDSDEDSFSDAQNHSCHSPSCAGSSHGDRRASAVSVNDSDGGRQQRKSSESETSVGGDLESGNLKLKVVRGKTESICRICHLSLGKATAESGILMALGCSCKDDLGAAHKKCAETWFNIKGNRTCEICGSIACNVVVPSNASDIDQQNESSPSAAPPSQRAEIRRFLQGHRFLKFLLSCLVLAFVIYWLFHLNIHSKYEKYGRQNGKAVSYHASISP